MKKILVFLVMLMIPIMTIAKEYIVSDINLKIDIPDSNIVFTRDNLKENKDLSELGIEEEEMTNFFVSSDVYLDIVSKDLSYEILIVVPKNSLPLNNFSNVTKEMLDDYLDSLKKKVNASDGSIYKSNHNYLVVDYYDSNSEKFLLNYYTVVNARGYNFQLQKGSPITEEERDNLKKIVDSVSIDIPDEYKEESSDVQEEINNYGKSKFNWKKIIIGTITGGLIGGLSSAIMLFIKKKMNKTSE